MHYRTPHYRFLPVALEDAAPFEDMVVVLPHPDYPDLDTKRANQLITIDYYTVYSALHHSLLCACIVTENINLFATLKTLSIMH